MKKDKLLYPLLRYLSIVVLSLCIPLFYSVLSPITVYLSAQILTLFYQEVSVMGNAIIFNNTLALIANACVAGSAYYLLTILNLGIKMKPQKRVASLLFLFASFLAINVIRIVSFAILSQSGFRYFNLAHDLVWYIGSTVIVVLIWFTCIKLFSIKDIPFYSDFKTIALSFKKKKISR